MAAKPNPYAQDLDKSRANHVPLTPLSFIERSAQVFPARPSVVHGAARYTWSETYARCRRLACGLARRGIGNGDTVAVMLPNIPAMYEAHFGVPMCGAVLNPLNTRLDAETIAFMLRHAEAKVLITDREFSPVVGLALAMLETKPVVIDVDDPSYEGGRLLGTTEYETFLAGGDPEYAWQNPSDEWDAIAVSYTSGTTGDPKGVVTHHRGAYLNAVCNAATWTMPHFPRYLWTLPMFHCNGWCFPWTIAMLGGVHVCLRRIDAAAIFEAIRRERVDHYCAAPIVHNLLAAAPEALRAGIGHTVRAMVAGAAPPASMIEGMARIGFDLTH